MTFKKSVLQCSSIALLTALICGLVFSCPVFAVDSFPVVPSSGEPLVCNTDVTIFQDSLPENITYCFASYNQYVGTQIHICSESFGQLVTFSSGGNVQQVTVTESSYISDYGIYNVGSRWGVGSVDSLSIPYFADELEGYAALRDFIDNGGSSSGDLISASSYFGVPAGYAAYVELPSSSIDWDVTVTQDFDEYSSLFGGQWSPMTSLWGFQSSLPSGSGNFSKSGLTVIPMYKMKPYTVLGQSKTGFSNKSTMVANGFWQSTPSAKYLVIYNPVIRAVSGTVGGASISDNVYVYNKGISVTMSGYYSPVKYYKLESTVTSSGLESSPADGTFEDSEYTENFDTDGNSEGIFNSSGDSSTLTDGGGDLIPSATSIGDYVRNLNQTLNNFASNFIDLMTSPISHVQQLINAGSNYFNVIQGLYGWLPDEVHAVVKSGMVVALSIGVISVLL